MAGIAVDLVCLGGSKTAKDAIASVLARAGVLVSQAASGSAAGPVLLSFDEVHEDVCATIQEQSGLGTRRVIALAIRASEVTTRDTWRLMEAGAADVLAWDSNPPPTSALAARLRRYAQVDELLESPQVHGELIGSSPTWLRMLRQIIEIAHFTEASVLLTGESGTGKELVARLIHSLHPRPNDRELVVLDCTTVSPELAGSEFFGHERGAFTHAIQARDGAFALADGGVLFLDEVGELPLALQAELLRVIQERTYKRVGSNTWKKVNFRLVCATNRDLDEEQSSGRFRSDFYHRIAAWTCHLPPLRERREDIPALTTHFLREFFGEPVPQIDAAVLDYLLTREYPGNVRELRQLVGRLAHRHVGEGSITIGDIPEEERARAASLMRSDWRDGDLQRSIRRALSQGLGLKDITAQTADAAIRMVLDDEDGNIRRAATKLRVTERALQMRRAAGRQREPALDGDDHQNGNGTDAELETPEPSVDLKMSKGRAPSETACQ